MTDFGSHHLQSFPALQESGGALASSSENCERLRDVLDLVDDVLQDDPLCLDPRPIGPPGCVSVVNELSLADTCNMIDDGIADLLHPFLNTTRVYDYTNLKQPAAETQHFSSDDITPFDVSSFLMMDEPVSPPQVASMPQRQLQRQLQVQQQPKQEQQEEDSSVSARFKSHQSGSWSARFEELCEFKKHFGHCLIPYKWKVDPALSQWVKRQRYQYKLKQQNKHSTLTDDRQKALENVGFVWDSHACSWEERFNELKEFQSANGHCNVPTTLSATRQLSIWIKCQRRQARLFWKNKPCNINQERIAKLSSIGFVWNPLDNNNQGNQS